MAKLLVLLHILGFQIFQVCWKGLLTAAERLRFSFAHALVSAGKTAGKIEFVGKEKIRWIAYDNIHPTIYKCSAPARGRQKFHLKKCAQANHCFDFMLSLTLGMFLFRGIRKMS